MSELLVPSPTNAQVAASGWSSRRGYLKAYEQQQRLAKMEAERRNLIAGTGDFQPRSTSRYSDAPDWRVVAEYNRRRLDRREPTDEKEAELRQAYRACVHLRGSSGCPAAMARFGNLLGFTDPQKFVDYVWSAECARRFGSN
jgi:hypothetical protein